MPSGYKHLGVFSDLVAAVREWRPLFPTRPSAEVRRRVGELLDVGLASEQPAEVRTERTWERDGLLGEEVSWSVGYGPRTRAWLLRPARARGPLPAAIALHDHGHFKRLGREKIADGPDDPDPAIVDFRHQYYGGRAFANALAHAGFAVLVPDTFLWGSRRFPPDTLPDPDRALVPAVRALMSGPGVAAEIADYNAGAVLQEHIVAKYCSILGTSVAALVAYEDRVALAYLGSRADVLGERVGCVGLSGGGCRAALLQATSDAVAAAVIVGMMCTYPELLDHDVAPHTWMFFPPGLSRFADWPDLAACRAPSPLLVQYALEDDLFTPRGMRDADARIGSAYAAAGSREAYRGEFYPGGHRFDVAMQDAAFSWLGEHLGPASRE